MSSMVESDGAIAAAVMLPIAAVYGAGWLAFQIGKSLLEANRAIDRQIAEKKRQIDQAAMHRKRSALAAHDQLVDMCTQVLSQIDSTGVRAIDFAELEQVKSELQGICNARVPEDVMQIESLTSLGFLKLDEMVAKQKHLASLQLEEKNHCLYRGLALADLMQDVNVAVSAMGIRATEGKDVRAADPVVLERAKLNEKLGDVAARTLERLEYAKELSAEGGLSASNNAWFHSCFNGIDDQFDVLYMPSTSNTDLKKGIKRVEGMLKRFDMLIPTLEKERKMMSLYKVYKVAAKNLGESVADIGSFRNMKALENELQLLKKRSERAQECAKIYQKLGPTAYICYAWDQELRAIGYSVHSRKDVADMASAEPQKACRNGIEIPPYVWNGEELTQIYSMASKCSLQVIVHDNGSVSMQAVSDADSSTAMAVQANHCANLSQIRENLKKNWLITYDKFEEKASSNEITSTAEWFHSKGGAWEPESEISRRKKQGRESKGKQEGESKVKKSQARKKAQTSRGKAKAATNKTNKGEQE